MVIKTNPLTGKPHSDGIQKARCQTSQIAVAKGRFRLQFLKLLEGFTVFLEEI